MGVCAGRFRRCLLSFIITLCEEFLALHTTRYALPYSPPREYKLTVARARRDLSRRSVETRNEAHAHADAHAVVGFPRHLHRLVDHLNSGYADFAAKTCGDR